MLYINGILEREIPEIEREVVAMYSDLLGAPITPETHALTVRTIDGVVSIWTPQGIDSTFLQFPRTILGIRLPIPTLRDAELLAVRDQPTEAAYFLQQQSGNYPQTHAAHDSPHTRGTVWSATMRRAPIDGWVVIPETQAKTADVRIEDILGTSMDAPEVHYQNVLRNMHRYVRR